MLAKKITLLLSLILLFVALIALWLRKPLLYSNWDKDVKVLAKVKLAKNKKSFLLEGIRNWSYTEVGPIDESIYFNQDYNFEDLEKGWFYLQPLEFTGLIAHTFIVFQFKDTYKNVKKLGLSIETRRRVGEEYSLLKGALRGFMVTHIWATESDLTKRRTDYLGYKLEKYELNLTKKQLKEILLAFLVETKSLHTTPKFYNTFTNNCTNALAAYINKNQKNPVIPFHYSLIFTGRSSKYLKRLGYLK